MVTRVASHRRQFAGQWGGRATTTSIGCSRPAHPRWSSWPCPRIGPWRRRTTGRAQDPVPDRETPLGDGRRRAGPPGRGHRTEPPGRRRRLSPAGARHHGRGPGTADRHPAQLFVARWLDSTPAPAWWGRTDEGGGQVVEQATHLYDLARYLVGEATVVGAASTRDLASVSPEVDVADSSAAVIRFDSGAVGSLANSHKISTAVIEVEIVSDGLLTRLSKRPDRGQGDWHASFDDGTVIRAISRARPVREAGRLLPGRRGRPASGRRAVHLRGALVNDSPHAGGRGRHGRARLTLVRVGSAAGRRSCQAVPGTIAAKLNRREPGTIGFGSATNLWTPTLHSKPAGASKAIGSNPASANHRRMSTVRSGGRRCRVQTTVAPESQSVGRDGSSPGHGHR